MPGRTNAERQRRYIDRLNARAAPPRGDLSNELAQTKAQIAEMRHGMPKPSATNASTRTHASKAAAPDAASDARLKALTTENQNLKAKLRDLQQGHRMDFATLTAVVKALHPDRIPTADERAAAYQAFTAWKAASAKARRKA
jgi:septal ring factor EnvC (AmiA/AmiB activator)